MKAALPDVAVHYAVKALPHASVLRTLADEGCNFDIASTGELELLLGEGVRPERIIHTHPIKTEDEVRNAVANGCRTFVYDNPDEIPKFERYRERIKLILRVAFRNPEATVDLSKKFGADAEDVVPLIRLAYQKGLQTIGLSFHVGSQCADSLAHVAAIRVCEGLIAAVSAAGLPALRVLDIGGGFPAPYTGESQGIAEFCRPIQEALAHLPRFIRVISEPGRYMVASAGHTASSVIGRAERVGSPWYYLDDGVYGSFGAQVFDGIYYPLSVLTASTGPTRISHLAGPTCDSGDMVSNGIALPPLAVGDVIIAHLMGAYSCVTANDFNSVPRAKVLILNGPSSKSGVIRVRLPTG
jgi:ornithine decarboxylase